MALSTVSDLNSYFNLIYERATFVARHRSLMANIVAVRNARGWMDRKIGQRTQSTAVAVTETTDYAGSQTFGTSLVATISPGEAIAQYTLSDRQIETDPFGARVDAETELGGSIAEKIDVDLVGDFSSFTTEKGPGSAAALTFAHIGAGVAVVDYAKARRYGPLSIVLHPYQWHDIWAELGRPASSLSLVQEVAVQALRDYFVADMLNSRWYTSGNIPIVGASPPDDATGAIFGARALMLDVRRPFRLEPERDASLRAWELNATVGYGHGIVYDAEGVKITSDATEPAG